MDKKASSVAKGLAILMMLTHHLFFSQETILQNSGGLEISYNPFSLDEVTFFAQAMKVCVAVFVFITAYGTYIQLSKKRPSSDGGLSIGGFYTAYSVSHWVKLLFNFWAVAVPFVLLGLAFPDHSPVAIYGKHGIIADVVYAIVDFLGLATLFQTPTMNATWWYMSLAFALIFLMPALHAIARKIGSVNLLVLSFAVPILANFDMGSDFLRWLPTAVLGIVFAEYGLFEKWSELTSSRIKSVADMAISFGLLCLFLIVQSEVGFPWFFESLGALMVCRLAQHLAKVSVVLDYLGKHSMNMFLLHTFIYKYYFSWLIYGAHWFIAIFLALVLASLLCSWIIEFLKKVTRYNELRNRVVARIYEGITKLVAIG